MISKEIRNWAQSAQKIWTKLIWINMELELGRFLDLTGSSVVHFYLLEFGSFCCSSGFFTEADGFYRIVSFLSVLNCFWCTYSLTASVNGKQFIARLHNTLEQKNALQMWLPQNINISRLGHLENDVLLLLFLHACIRPAKLAVNKFYWTEGLKNFYKFKLDNNCAIVFNFSSLYS